MMIVHSFVKIITTHTHTKPFYLVIRTCATFYYNDIQETTSTLPQDACIIIHTHTHTHRVTISNTNFTHTHTNNSHKKLNLGLTVFFQFLKHLSSLPDDGQNMVA